MTIINLSIIKDLINKYRFGRTKQIVSFHNYCSPEKMKIVFTSGSAKRFNGGTKLYNLWVKLLKENGYDAYIATIDGKYDKWLVNHQPVISYKKVLEFKKHGYEIKIVSGWLGTPLEKILGESEQFYYFDAELHWTIKFKRKLDKYLKQRKIAGVATHSKHIQSWYMANYGFKPLFINEWSDNKVFYPKPSKRIKGRIGCMPESKEEEEFIEYILRRCKCENLGRDLIRIKGTEKEVAQKMQTVDIFIGLNKGKNELWGEGCPRTQQEAMHSGAALVAFDCLGNREYLIDGYTGLLVSKYDKEEIWKSIRTLLTNHSLKEHLRTSGIDYIRNIFSDKGKLRLISDFLYLEGNTKKELSTVLNRPFWLQEDEVSFLSRYASKAKKIIVEIGCAYGGSSTIFLLNKEKNTKLYSIDPFVKDSMGDFRASKRQCYSAVSKALQIKHKQHVLKDWCLIKDYSYNFVKNWNQKIDILFIDGSHLYDDVKKDFDDWAKFLSKDGIIMLHDSRKDNIKEDPRDKVFSVGWAGPTKLVDDILRTHNYELVDSCYSISVIKKV